MNVYMFSLREKIHYIRTEGPQGVEKLSCDADLVMLLRYSDCSVLQEKLCMIFISCNCKAQPQDLTGSKSVCLNTILSV